MFSEYVRMGRLTEDELVTERVNSFNSVSRF